MEANAVVVMAEAIAGTVLTLARKEYPPSWKLAVPVYLLQSRGERQREQ